MAITLSSSNFATFASTDAPSVSTNSGVAEGDLMYLALSKDDNDSIGQGVFPSGWTYLSTMSGTAATSYELRIGTKTAGASEHPSTYTFGDWGGLEDAVLGYVSFSGVDSIQTVQYKQDTSASASSITFDSVNVTTDGSVLVVFLGMDEASAGWTPPSVDWIEVWDEAVSVMSGACFYREIDAGATGSLTFSISGSDQIVASMAVLTPTTGGGGFQSAWASGSNKIIGAGVIQ